MSPAKKPATPTTDVTPEQAMSAIERTITEMGVFGGGQRRQALLVSGQRLYKALNELKAAEAHAAELRAGMAGLVGEALNAINGTTTPKAPKGRDAGVQTTGPDIEVKL